MGNAPGSPSPGGKGRKLLVHALSNAGSNKLDSPRLPPDLPASLVSVVKANPRCADCVAAAGPWADVRHGVLICAACAGAHRSLGTDIAFVQSVTMDVLAWTEDRIEMLVGNEVANRELEFYVPAEWPRPDEHLGSDYRLKFVKAKYAERAFTMEHAPAGCVPQRAVARKETPHASLKRKQSEQAGKVAMVGCIEVTVHEARKLDAKDSLTNSSDPYVVVALGAREAKTTIKKRTTDPLWNEGPEQNPALRFTWDGKSFLFVSVFDHDRFKHDDLIGRAAIDLDGIEANKSQQLWLKLVDDSSDSVGRETKTWHALKRAAKKIGGVVEQPASSPRAGDQSGRSSGFLRCTILYVDFT